MGRMAELAKASEEIDNKFRAEQSKIVREKTGEPVPNPDPAVLLVNLQTAPDQDLRTHKKYRDDQAKLNDQIMAENATHVPTPTTDELNDVASGAPDESRKKRAAKPEAEKKTSEPKVDTERGAYQTRASQAKKPE